MKIIICGDIHIGARNASLLVCEYQLKYFNDVLFPYMEKNKITTILQLGDLFDSRKFSNHVILHEWKDKFFDVLELKGFKLITLLGNHDIASRNSLKINSTALLLQEYITNGVVECISTPTEKRFGDTTFLLLPWICDENRSDVLQIVKETETIYCAGHFEFTGFEMQKGIPSTGGECTSHYEKFDTVFSGHYHTKSKQKNISYVGTPYEMTWADYNDQKSVVVFDTISHKPSIEKNLLTLFSRIEYNDKDDEPSVPNNLRSVYVKVVVINKTNPYHFEKFITNILAQSPADLKITDIETDFDGVDIEDELVLDDTKTLVDKFIDQVDTDLKKDKLKDMMNSLYLSALEITQ